MRQVPSASAGAFVAQIGGGLETVRCGACTEPKAARQSGSSRISNASGALSHFRVDEVACAQKAGHRRALLIRAHDLGHGQFYGEMDVRPRKDDGEFETKVMLKSVKDGSTLFRLAK